MVELEEVLHVSEDDVLLVDDARRDLLHAAGHLPQIRLHGERGDLLTGLFFPFVFPFFAAAATPTLTSMHSLRSRTYAFSV